jgi:predicted O-linked N-acetylglucosamine transferase (SPINDLY family)
MTTLAQHDANTSESAMSLAELIQLAEVLQQNGHELEAVQVYRHWLNQSQDGNRFLAWFNFGALLQKLNLIDEAQSAYLRCLEIQPHMAQASINLGLLQEQQGNNDAALQHWSHVVAQALLQANPDKSLQTTALNHMGRLYEKLKQYDLAEQALAQSLMVDPKQSGAIQHWVHIRQKACKWPVYKSLPKVSMNDMLMYTSPLAMLSLSEDPVMQLLCAQSFVTRTYGQLQEEHLCKVKQYGHSKIRIGYVSGDLCTHAVGLLMADFIEAHDRERFEIYGYDFSPEDGSAYRERLKKSFDHIRFVHSLSESQIAQVVVHDEIDVLIDLHGLSSGARPGIFALHPAPLQGTYLGYIGTTAMPWFDFVVCDRWVLPDELTPYFKEPALYLEGSFIPMNKDEPTLRVAHRSEFSIPEDALVMAAFGNVYKINESMFGVWCNILHRVEKSVLWLIDDNPATTRELKHQAKLRGIEEHQIIFTPRAAHSEYRSRIKLADVFLDNYPYNCGSTTADVIRCGVPIVTRYGKTMVSRMGKSILSSLGLHELITSTQQDYEELVVSLLRSPEQRDKIRKQLAIQCARVQQQTQLNVASLETALVQRLQALA